MTKIEALRETSRQVKAGTLKYDWGDMTTCNCGLVAQTVSNLNASELRDAIFYMRNSGDIKWGLWNDIVNWRSAICPLTSLPVHHVIRKLRETGFTSEELSDLENMENRDICKRAKIIPGHGFELVENFLAYIDAWADMLEATN